MQQLLIQMLFQLLSLYVQTQYHTFLITHDTETDMNTRSCTKYESNFYCAKLHLQNWHKFSGYSFVLKPES